MSVEINRFEFEEACKLYTASLNSNNNTYKPPKPPEGCPTEIVNGGWRFIWNQGKPYKISAQTKFGVEGIRIRNSRRYYVTLAGYKKACSVARKTGFTELTFKPPIR